MIIITIIDHNDNHSQFLEAIKTVTQTSDKQIKSIVIPSVSLLLLSLVASCRSSSPDAGATLTSNNVIAKQVEVVAAENFWGSITSQIGGDRIKVTSVITNPNTDPHDYEAKPADARTVARAKYVIFNGAGYDSWMTKLLVANPVEGRKELNIGDLVGKKAGDNPHLWYNPSYVYKTIDRITSDLKSIDPSDASYFDQQRANYLNVSLKPYKQLISLIKHTYQGTPVGATESIFADQSLALGLNLITPPEFMRAIAEGQQPTARDKATMDSQITDEQIKLLIYNKQNSTPDVEVLKQKAEMARIPIVPITETLSPATATFQSWQIAQLQDLQQALARATGKRITPISSATSGKL